MKESESTLDGRSTIHPSARSVSPASIHCTSKASWEVTYVTDELACIALRGAVTEETDLGPLVASIRPETRIDLSGATEINSCGVREWMEFIERVDQGGGHVVLERCAPCIVIQLNLVSNFIGERGRVLSILAPYACEDCEHEERELLTLDRKDVEIADSLPCPKCGGDLCFEELPQIYLQFHRESFCR